MAASDILLLNGAPSVELSELSGEMRTRETWEAIGFAFTGHKDIYGWIATYGGKEAHFWTLDHDGDGWAGMVWGSGPTQGHGVLARASIGPDGVVDRTAGPAEQPWYFRARHDAWSFQLAADMQSSPLEAAYFRWSESYEGASYMVDGDAWPCIERAIAIYRDPLVQWILAGTLHGGSSPDRGTRPSLDVAWSRTTCWPLMVSIVVQANGPIEELRRTLWSFGIHARGEPHAEWASEFPLDYVHEPGTYAQALAGAGSDEEVLERTIADAIRALWPAPIDTGSLSFVRASDD